MEWCNTKQVFIFKNNHTLQMSVLPHFVNDLYGHMYFRVNGAMRSFKDFLEIEMLTQK